MSFVTTEEFELCRIKTEKEVRRYCFVVKDAAATLNAICQSYLRDPNYHPQKAEQGDDFNLLAGNFPNADHSPKAFPCNVSLLRYYCAN